MKAYKSIPTTTLLLIATISLAACGDNEDYFLEPGYGHNLTSEAEMVQLAQVRTNQPEARPALMALPSIDPTILSRLNDMNDNHAVHEVFEFDEPTDEENRSEALGEESLGLTPQLNIPSSQFVDTMTPAELSRTCASIEAQMESADEQGRITGNCTFDYMANISGGQTPSAHTCDLRMNKCIDQSTAPINPIAFCQTPTKVPETCEVSYPEINGCLRALKESQQALNEIDICDASVFTSQEADIGYGLFRAAQACLIKLDTHCPVLLND